MLVHLALVAALAAFTPADTVKIVGTFNHAEGKDGNLSGIACRPSEGGPHWCLLIDDELQAAQVASYDGSAMTVMGATPAIALKATRGEPPVPPAGLQVSGFKEWDGEAVAWSDPWFYVVGSHGLSRSSGKFRHSSFQIGRVRLDAAGKPTGKMETSYRLTDRLRAAGELKRSFAMPLNGGGLNIEGAAVVGGSLWLGLRAPSIGNRAFLVKLAVEPLFAERGSAEVPTVVPVELGANIGIRDIAALGDGRLILLSGDAVPGDPATPLTPALWLFDPKTRKLDPLGAVPLGDVKAGAKAEGLALISQTGKRVDLLMVFDGPSNGDVRRKGIELP